jgi:hypothetical protein
MSHPYRNLTRADWRIVTFVPLSILGILGAVIYPGAKEWYAGATTPCSSLLSEDEIRELTKKTVDRWSHYKNSDGCRSWAVTALKKDILTIGVDASCGSRDWTTFEGFESVEKVEGLADTELATMTNQYQIRIGLGGEACISAGTSRTPTNREATLRLVKLLASRRDVAAKYVQGLER